MNFFEKYSTHYESISKTPKKRSINVVFKFFETPVRKGLQLIAYSMIFSNQTINSQAYNMKRNKIVTTEKIFFLINPNKMHSVVQMKKIKLKKNKIKLS